MKHVVLLGDSIFDNGVYVPGEPAVIDQLRSEMPDAWEATLLAVDGDVTADIHEQLRDMPEDASDCAISCGGNDALGHAHLIERAESIDDLAASLAVVLPEFQRIYANMLDAVLDHNLNTVVCTIYDQCPFPEPKWREFVPVALDAFNALIKEVAANRNVSIIELREICTEPEDYSGLSPIEPSAIGGMKIVQAIVRDLTQSPVE